MITYSFENMRMKKKNSESDHKNSSDSGIR